MFDTETERNLKNLINWCYENEGNPSNHQKNSPAFSKKNPNFKK